MLFLKRFMIFTGQQYLEYMFQLLKQNFYHREKTFIALSYNNLSTVFQKCINYALFHGH